MNLIFLSLLLLGLFSSYCTASGLSGPFLLWGQERLKSFQRNSLIEGNKHDFENLYKDAKAIVVFIRNNTNTRLEASQFPEFQSLIHTQAWTYLPQRALTIEPFKYNSNVELINLNRFDEVEDAEIVAGFNDAINLYGEGAVLGILANAEDETSKHSISKRENKENETTSTQEPPTSEETDESFIYVADGGKAALYLNNAPVLNISNKESIKLVEHRKEITFDDQKAKGYGRLNIIFIVEGDKLFLRFNFTISRGSWTMKAVEVEHKDYKNVLTLNGHAYSLPSAPVKFSYRCGAEPLIFRNGSDSLTLNDYQVQPWLNGATSFGDVYDCVGFTTAPIWAGILVTLFLCGILSIGLMALYDIKTPNKFESSRSKQLTFAVQE